MPYYKVTWEVCVRAKDEEDAVDKADEVRESKGPEVVEMLEAEAKKEFPADFETPWPSVTFVLQNGKTWQGEGPLLDVLDHFLDDGLELRHVIAIIPTQE